MSNESMIEHLKAIAARLVRELRRWPPFPEEPLTGVREPRRHGPAGRGSAASVDEPREPSPESADCVGRVDRVIR